MRPARETLCPGTELGDSSPEGTPLGEEQRLAIRNSRRQITFGQKPRSGTASWEGLSRSVRRAAVSPFAAAMARSAQSWCDPHSKHGNASGERPPTSSRTNSRSLIWAVSVNTISAASRKRTAYPIGRFGPVKERTPEVSNLGGASGRREPAENPRDRSQRRSNFHHHAAAILTRWILRSCRFTTDSRLPLAERWNYSTSTPGMARVARSCCT